MTSPDDPRGPDQKRSLHQLLVHRLVHGSGTASAEQRSRAFEGSTLPEPLQVLLDKTARRSDQLTDADFDRAAQAGSTDDQLFELVICAAVGHSTRQYDAGLAALAEAITEAETR